MDLNNIIPLILNLFEKNENENNQPNKQEPPTQDFSSAMWQLPTYDFNQSQTNTQNFQGKNKNSQTQNFSQNQSQNFQKNSQSSFNNNTQNTNLQKPSFDLSQILELAQAILPLFQKKETTKTEEKKEVFPSYISKLPRTDNFNFD